MKYTLAITALALSIGSAAISQEQTYDEIISGGGMQNISNMEQHLATILEQNGVSRDCMGKLTVGDAAQINTIINNSNASRREKEQKVKVILDKKC